jgi:hypothetical protein
MTRIQRISWLPRPRRLRMPLMGSGVKEKRR